MRNPNNIISLSSHETEFDILTINELAPVKENVYDFLDEKDIKKYIADVERCVRTSFEYRKYISYLRENFDMSKCSIYENVSNVDTYNIKIHIHHEPITLYDMAVTIFNKRKFFNEDLSVEMTAKEVMYVHYLLMVGLIPLSETVHELVHNQYIFIPTNKVFGHYKEFIDTYNDFLPEGLLETLEEIEKASIDYEDQLQVLEKHYIYIDADEVQSKPNIQYLQSSIQQRIDDLKNNNIEQPIKTVCPIKKI